MSGNIVLNVDSGRNKQMIPNKKLGQEIIGEALKSIGSDTGILDYARLFIRSKHKRAIYTRLACNEQFKNEI